MKLAAGMEHRVFVSVEAAIRLAAPLDGSGPLDARAIDYGHVSGGDSGPWQMAARLDREARVRAILGQFPRQRQAVLAAFAWNMPVGRVAKVVGSPRSTVHRWWQEDRERFRQRLQEAGLMDSSGT